jgi:hypothetical protein
MAVTSYQIATQSPDGTASINSSTGALTFIPNNGFIGIATGTYNILCDGIVCSTATWSVTVTGYCNDSFIIKAVKNNCIVGTPSNIDYIVPANLVCNKSTKEEANWIAYQQSLPLAQSQVNLLPCVQNCVPQPCVIESRFNYLLISGIPGNKINIYNSSGLLLQVIINLTGLVEIKSNLIVGNIWVTQENTQGGESFRECKDLVIEIDCPECCND